MSLESNLSEEDQKDFEDFFNGKNSNFKLEVKYKIKNNENVIKDAYENINKTEKNNVNDTQVGIIDKNENENEKKKIINYKHIFETNIDEPKKDDLPNSKYSKFPKKIKKIVLIVKRLDRKNKPNNYIIKNKKNKKKRGRVKKSNDKRNHNKKDKDNNDLKIYGLIIDTCRSFINKKLKNNNLRILKKLNYKEKRKLNIKKDIKFNMNKKLKDIFGNVSNNKYGKNYNKDIIDKCDQNDPILKEIFELPLYKVIQDIYEDNINILKGLDHEYNLLKNQLFLEEDDDDYINLFNEREASIINLAKNKYLNENIDINFISNNNFKIFDASPFSSLLFNENEAKLVWGKSEFSNEKITNNKTLDSMKNADKIFISNTNDEILVKDDLSWKIPDISNAFDKKLDINDLYRQIPGKSNNSNISDSDSLSSKYSLIDCNNENDDFH